MISLLYACGFRVSELVNLKIKNLDFNEKIGHARQAKGKKDRGFNIPSSLFFSITGTSRKTGEKFRIFIFRA